jgi:hypothetical protein
VGVTTTCVPRGIGVEIHNARRNPPLRLHVADQFVTVRPGATRLVAVRVPEGERYDIRVSDGRRSVHLRGRRSCSSPPPSVTVAPDCTNGGMDVTIVNGDAERAAVLRVNGDTVSVPQGSTKTVDVPVDDNGEYSIRVLGRNAFARTFAGVRTCASQPAEGSVEQPIPAAPVLPITGAALGGVVAGGVFLFGSGALVLLLARRSRRRRLPL